MTTALAFEQAFLFGEVRGACRKHVSEEKIDTSASFQEFLAPRLHRFLFF